jgi:hypothetical protein
MSEKTVKLGLVFSAKVGGSYIPVRIDKALGKGRYEGVALPSGRPVKTCADAIRGDGQTEEAWRAKRTPQPAPDAPAPAKEAQGSAGPAATAKQKPDAKATKTAKGKTKVTMTKADAVNAAMTAVAVAKKARPAKQRKPGGLDAAVAVLAEAGKPMHTADMVKRMLETGLWKTHGKTPAATIYAAIIREIAVKGDKSRFRKTDRGTFDLTAAGKGVK